MIRLAKALEPSRRAAAACGPKQSTPAFSQASTMPSTRGTSGPGMTKSMFFSLMQRIRLSMSSPAIGMFSPRRAVPPLPGAMNSSGFVGLWDNFQAKACSRPPEPIIRIRTLVSSLIERNVSRRGERCVANPLKQRGSIAQNAIIGKGRRGGGARPVPLDAASELG